MVMAVRRKKRLTMKVFLIYTMCHLERVKILDYYVFFLLAKAGK